MSGPAQDGTSRAEAVAQQAIAGIDRVASAADELVPNTPSLANSALPDTSRATRWAGLLFALCALLLAPWIIVIALTLPSRQLSPNYDVAWAGFDALLFVALSSTAATALRRSRHLAVASSWSAALLVTDAWFDVMTAPSGRDMAEAIGMACMVELPLAGTCLWLSRHSQDIADRRLALLARRASKRQGSSRHGNRFWTSHSGRPACQLSAGDGPTRRSKRQIHD